MIPSHGIKITSNSIPSILSGELLVPKSPSSNFPNPFRVISKRSLKYSITTWANIMLFMLLYVVQNIVQSAGPILTQ